MTKASSSDVSFGCLVFIVVTNEREREKTRLWLVFAFPEERERSPKMGAKRKKAVVSARCPPPPKHHHHRRTNVVRVQKHAFSPNPRVPFAFHLREKAKLASSFLREPNCLSPLVRERKLQGQSANLREREKERNKRFIRERAFTSFSLDSCANEIRSPRFEQTEV